MNMKQTLGIFFVIVLITLTGCIQTQPNQENTINVQGTSELSFKPDQAEVSVGISIVKKTAADAQSEANKVINAIIDGLRYKGIAESDISTEQLNLYEDKEWRNNEYVSNGWRATQTLKIKTIDLTKVGTIVDVAANNGANQINGINFGLTPAKEAEYKKQALADATKNAKDKAETIADSLGAKLGAIQSVSESNYYYRPYMYDMMVKTASAGAIQEAATVMPSDVSVSAQISIVYAIK
jgi:uncharacterized protein YggE